MTLYVDEGRDRSIHADHPSDLLEPEIKMHLDQPMFLPDTASRTPADGIHGDEEYLYVVERRPGTRSKSRPSGPSR